MEFKGVTARACAFATLRDVRGDSLSPEDVARVSIGPWNPPRQDARVRWGPVSLAEAVRSGAFTPASSVLLEPKLPDDLLKSVQGLIPAEAFPRPSDTAQTLAARLGCLDWLDGKLQLLSASQSEFPAAW